ncbi:MAG: hypothetical protein F6J87_02910 [Spirulina sp. SIO3F2]|nr:hypothetical protein [Spirulina sp. SIO3F2]
MVQPLLETAWSTIPPTLLLPQPVKHNASQQYSDFPKATIPSEVSWQDSTPALLMTLDLAEPTSHQDTVHDPLNSPHPVPWNWILETYETFKQSPHSEPRHYRSVSVVSPDGNYAAYSRIQMSTNADFSGSQVTSVMFLEDLQTGELQTVTASSPIAQTVAQPEKEYQTGIFSILVPVSWSQNGERLLARQFEGLLSTSIASDYAVIWERATQQTCTCVPVGPDYSNALVLGWSTTHPDQVLFRAGAMGEEPWLLWRVNPADGATVLATGEQPIVFGQLQSNAWGGAQMSWS